MRQPTSNNNTNNNYSNKLLNNSMMKLVQMKSSSSNLMATPMTLACIKLFPGFSGSVQLMAMSS
jgi:hypothetical protein